MLRFLTLCAAAALATSAGAQTCTPREYAQYRDDLKSGAGRITVAFGMCRDAAARDRLRATSKPAEQCDAEVRKATDALTAAQDPAALEFARAGCKGELPAKR
jgi:hypothetical protein